MLTICKAPVLSTFQTLMNSVPRTTLWGWCYSSSYFVVEEMGHKVSRLHEVTPPVSRRGGIQIQTVRSCIQSVALEEKQGMVSCLKMSLMSQLHVSSTNTNLSLFTLDSSAFPRPPKYFMKCITTHSKCRVPESCSGILFAFFFPPKSDGLSSSFWEVWWHLCLFSPCYSHHLLGVTFHDFFSTSKAWFMFWEPHPFQENTHRCHT